VKTRIKRTIATAAAVLAASTALVATSGNSWAQSGQTTTASLQAFGISSDGTIMASFWTNKPDTLNWFRLITGFVGDTAAIGIDYRVQDGQLYIVGNKGGIYLSDWQNPWNLLRKVSQLTVPLNGTNFGVDFNPAADRLRVISDQGQNLRHDLNTHTTISDATLTTPPAGTTFGVTGAAYTNNDLNGSTATTLFDIGTNTDQVLIQSPANNGTLAPTGSLGLDAGPNAGFDIYSNLSGGKTISNTAFASLTTPTPTGGTVTSLYTVDLLTGTPAIVGQFPFPITDVAVALDTAP
jgi:hypothetical protein